MKDKSSVQLYYDYVEQFELLTDGQLRKVVYAMIEYDKSQKITKLDKISNMAFSFIKKRIDYDKSKYHEKCAKNKENSEKYWKKKNNQSISNGIERYPTISDIDTDIDLDIGIDIDLDVSNKLETTMSSKLDGDAALILDYMNKVGERSFKHTKSNHDYIVSKLNEGFTVEECKDVVFNQLKEFIKRKLKKGDKDLSMYYRPSTLFGDKFEEYLQDYKRHNDRDVE